MVYKIVIYQIYNINYLSFYFCFMRVSWNLSVFCWLLFSSISIRNRHLKNIWILFEDDGTLPIGWNLVLLDSVQRFGNVENNKKIINGI